MTSNTYWFVWHWRNFTLLLTNMTKRMHNNCNSSDNLRFRPQRVERKCPQLFSVRQHVCGHKNKKNSCFGVFQLRLNSGNPKFKAVHQTLSVWFIASVFLRTQVGIFRRIWPCKAHLRRRSMWPYTDLPDVQVCRRNFDTVYHSSRDINISGLGGRIAISGCPSLSKSSTNTVFKLAIIEN